MIKMKFHFNHFIKKNFEEFFLNCYQKNLVIFFSFQMIWNSVCVYIFILFLIYIYIYIYI